MRALEVANVSKLTANQFLASENVLFQSKLLLKDSIIFEHLIHATIMRKDNQIILIILCNISKSCNNMTISSRMKGMCDIRMMSLANELVNNTNIIKFIHRKIIGT